MEVTGATGAAAVVVVPSLGQASTLPVVAPEVVLQAMPQAVAMVGGAGTVAKAGLKAEPKTPRP